MEYLLSDDYTGRIRGAGECGRYPNKEKIHE